MTSPLLDHAVRSVTVCVDYADILSLTLPYNRHHFSEMLIVTSFGDVATQNVALQNGCPCFMTNAFWHDGAKFNKWLALENAIEAYGRRGWLCLLDADIMLPKQLQPLRLDVGRLYTPLRRMFPGIANVPQEPYWAQYPVHRNVGEFAGYCQIFNAADPRLVQTPWFDLSWTHAGGADSFFQRRWPAGLKVRPPFEVLHLGEPCTNWLGRASAYADGTIPPESEQKKSAIREMFAIRRRTNKFDHEKI